MKKLLIAVLAVLPVLSFAQSKGVSVGPVILTFSSTAMYKEFTVPAGKTLQINSIYADVNQIKLKIYVQGDSAVRQEKTTQSLMFSRNSDGAFYGSNLTLPENTTIEFDGVPLMIFCTLR